MNHFTDDTTLLLTIKKAAERLGVTPTALTAAARRSGHLIKMGNRFYVKTTDLEQVIESARVPPVVLPEMRNSHADDISADLKLARAMETAEWLRTKGKPRRR